MREEYKNIEEIASEQFDLFSENCNSESAETTDSEISESCGSLSVINEQEVLGKQFRIYGTFENPLFLAKDVAKMIDYDWGSVNKMLKNLDDDEKVKNTYTSLGSEEKRKFNFGENEAWFVTENGIYELMFLIKTPIARQFKKEVKKILHEIRMKGSFRVPRTMKEALQIALEQQEKIEQQQKIIAEQTPKVEVYNRIADGKDCFSMNQTAKALQLPFGDITLFRKLRELGILNQDNTPKEQQKNAGHFKTVIKFVNEKIGNKTVTLTTGRGLVYLAKKFNTVVDKTIKADA